MNFAIAHPAKQDYLNYFTPYFVCFSAGLFFLFEFFQLNFFDVINDSLRLDFNLNAHQLSWMSSIYVWANVLFLIPAGVLLDKFSTRTLVLFCSFVCALATLGFAFTHSFVLATFFHAVTGIGNAFCFVSCMILVARWFEPNRQAFVVGCIITMAFLGGMVAHAPLAYLNQNYGWRYALTVDAIMGFLIWFWMFWTVYDRPKDIDCNHGSQSKGSPFLSVLSNTQNILAGLYTACLNLPILVFCALWGVTYLSVVYQLDKMMASKIISMIYFGSIFGCPLMGLITDYFGSYKRIMFWGAIFSALSLIMIILGHDWSPTQLALLFFLVGFFTSTQVISYPLIAKINHPADAARATSIASIIIMGGGGLGQILFGYLTHYHAGNLHSAYQIEDLQFAAWIFPVAIVLALLALIPLQEKNLD